MSIQPRAFVGSDDDPSWLARLAHPSADDDSAWLNRLRCDGRDGHFDSPFKAMHRAPLAQAVGWLVVTHHRLPVLPPGAVFQMSALQGLLTQVQPAWNESAYLDAAPTAFAPYWRFPHGLPVTSEAWRQRASRMARRLTEWQARQPAGMAGEALLNNPFVMHLCRLSLMLADHHYSRLVGASAERVQADPHYPLIANTLGNGQPNQGLDEHLLGVAQHGAEVAHFLPQLARHMPRLGRHPSLKQRAKSERFRWQDKAADLAGGLRERAAQNGAFIVNMASTGCGKTLANARIMYALADPAQGFRCAFALGLRTLTLQTGQAFRSLLNLGDEEVAIRVGGAANRALFEFYESQAEARGSESGQDLLAEDSHVLFEGSADQHPLLRRAVADPEVRKLLLAPLLVCTIDHLTPATESQRGGRQIAPMLRLMSGDLVLDEPDDFDLADLPALTRLVHWAGLLGARVLLSSATLPPALIQGLFEAYRNGRHHHQRNCGSQPGGADTPPVICCAWVDEFEQHAHDCPVPADFAQAHARFAQGRHVALARLATQPRRRAALLPAPALASLSAQGGPDMAALATTWAPALLAAALGLHHNHHSVDPLSGHRVSFGLIRMANIEPLIEVALALFRAATPAACRIHLCVYHSRHPLLVRSAIEQQLDQALRRHDADAVFALPDIRQRLDVHPEPDQLFIVLGSPVTEVGRDHDYDWAAVEPSSMRSLIQLAGRVRRHRPGAVQDTNILVLDHNLRHFRLPSQPAFCKPGFESPDVRLSSHDLQTLVRPEELAVIDARPRIVPQANLQPQHRLVRKLPLPVDRSKMETPASSRKSDEEVPIHGVPDPVDPGRRRGRLASGRGVPQARHQHGELLPVQEQVRRAGAGERRDQGRAVAKIVTPIARRAAVQIMVEDHHLSRVRACQAVGLPRSALYKPTKDQAARDAPVIQALNEVVEKRPRWGFWKCFERLRCDGHGWNHKRVYRVYCSMRLNLKRKARRRLITRERQPLLASQELNRVWALDFMRDTLYDGRSFRTLNVIDEGNREALRIECGTSIPSARVVRVMNQLIEVYGKPEAVRLDNGPELTADAFVDWAKEHGVKLMFIQPGKPNQNAFVERFNRSFREEVLDAWLFNAVSEVQSAADEWMTDYNEFRPHESLGNVAPAVFKPRVFNQEVSTSELST